MWLGELIDRLKKEPPNKAVARGFGHPHSYRGYYECLAFAPVSNTTVGEMLKCAEAADGATYQGWKGGDFKMSGLTHCYLASKGDCGDALSELLLDYILNDPRPWGEPVPIACGEPPSGGRVGR